MEDIVVYKIDETKMQLNCDRGIALELWDYFAFKAPNYQFHPKYKAKVWDGKIRLYNLNSGTIYNGLINELQNFSNVMEYTIHVPEEYNPIPFSVYEAQQEIEKFKLPFSPRDYQLDAFIKAVRQQRGVIVSPTGSGKSLILYLLYRHYNLKTLIVVPTVSLVYQMKSDFVEYGADPATIHTEHAKSDDYQGQQLFISTWQSIYEHLPKFFHHFDVILGDEAHKFKATSLVSIMEKATKTRYRFGFTGTLNETQVHQLVLNGLFGNIIETTTTADLIDQKHLAELRIKSLILEYPAEDRKNVIKLDYHDEADWVVNNEKRTKFICNLALSLKGNTLVLFQYVDKQGKVLFDQLKANNTKEVFFVAGETEGQEREDIRNTIEQSDNAIIVASFGTFSTGINIKRLDNVIFAFAGRSKIRTLQSIGRVLRISEQKTKATLYDIVDDLKWKSKNNFLLEHYYERYQLYIEENFPVKSYTIQL